MYEPAVHRALLKSRPDEIRRELAAVVNNCQPVGAGPGWEVGDRMGEPRVGGVREGEVQGPCHTSAHAP